MQCPKCNHEQTSRVECEACGIIFEKYQRVQERKKAMETHTPYPVETTSPFSKILQFILLIIVVSGTTYYFTLKKKAKDVASEAVSTTMEKPIPARQADLKNREAPPLAIPEAPTKTFRSPIERARHATVSIKTPWGEGSGFFINQEYIVTNKHVIELDQHQLVQFKKKIERSREKVSLREQEIKDLKKVKERTQNNTRRRQIDIRIEEYQENLDNYLPELENAEEKLRKMENDINASDITVVLFDGTELTANYLMLSDEHDLALISLYSDEWTYLDPPPKGTGIRPGDTVYTVGSPVGLSNTITSGIFSGYRKRKDTGHLYLQIDAAINPGNSGGPLVDEHGYVHGVNTLIIKNTEGIGFAIPISVVFEEFSTTLF